MSSSTRDILRINEIARVLVDGNGHEVHLAAQNLFTTLMTVLYFRRPEEWTILDAINIAQDPDKIASTFREGMNDDRQCFENTEWDNQVLAYLTTALDQSKPLVKAAYRRGLRDRGWDRSC